MEEFERVRNELYEEEMKEKLRQEGLREVELKIRNKLELQAEEAEALMSMLFFSLSMPTTDKKSHPHGLFYFTG